MITITKSILIVWKSLSPIKVARLLIMSRGARDSFNGGILPEQRCQPYNAFHSIKSRDR
jgi:hypothetical protein